MGKETPEMCATRLMKQDRLTAEESEDMEAFADMFAWRSHAADSVARNLHQGACAMQQEAQRLHKLSAQAAAAAAAAAAVPSSDGLDIQIFK